MADENGSDGQDEATQLMMAQAAAPADTQQQACAECLTVGLQSIGIKPSPNDTIDFGAIDSDDLCIALAHGIEQCLDGKGYLIKPLSASFINLRATGARLTITALTTALVQLSWSAGGTE